MFTAFTEEIDDVEFAVSEILEQLDLDGLLSSSVGIVHCYSDFVESGVVAALGERLPFDIVGGTTLSVSTPGGMGQMALGITVMTSDDVRFTAGVSRPIEDDLDGPLSELCESLIGAQAEKPSLLIPFTPFLLNIGGDEFIAKIDELSGGLPAFGTLSISHESDYSKIYTFYKGESFPASLVLLTLTGEVKPEFFSVSVSDDNILTQKAVITGVNRNVLQTVNGMPTVKYLESIGLSAGGDVSGLVAMPFIVYLEDGSTLVRACVAADGENAILCGAVPEGSTLALATMGFEDVVGSTSEKVAEAFSLAKGRGLLMYSCAGRNWTLGMKRLAEHEAAAACIQGAAPYPFAYSGGEIFPERLADGHTVNHLQNDSLIICVL
jgi:hypothetical protein